VRRSGWRIGAAAWLLAGGALVPAAEVKAETRHGARADTLRVVTGRVLHDGRPVAEARLRVEGDSATATTAADGRFRLSVTTSPPTLLHVTAIGYRPREALLDAWPTAPLAITLERAPTALAPLVATGMLRERRVDEAPVKVEVVGSAFLARAASDNLMMSMDRVTGIQQQVDCGVCFTNSLRINGMEGPYTAVLVDGVPLMSSLASVYGLNGLHPAIIEQVEIVRGPASTLYGAEAMAGVINVVTRDPRYAPAWSASSMVTSHGELSLEAGAAPRLGGGHLLLSGTLARNAQFVDGNADGFTDLPLLTRGALFAKWSDGPASGRRLDVAVRLFGEDRFGGVRGWTPADRLSDRIYGEEIRTRRGEATVQWRLPARADLRLAAGTALHDQRSAYGTTPYAAQQLDAFAQLTLASRAGALGELLAGTALRMQRYDDGTPATAAGADVRPIPGVFGQLETELAPRLRSVVGLRADHHDAHGVVLAPRLALRWETRAGTVLRVNAATGFRPVNVFTEDHAALSGSRRVIFAETLRPERSQTLTAGLAQPVPFGGALLQVELDGFLTRFRNRILPDYDTDPDAIIYANADEGGVTRGISLMATLAPEQMPLSFRLGGTVQDVQVRRDGVSEWQPFSARFKGEWTVTWEFREGGTTLDWTGRLLGPMALPRFEGRAERSPWFTEQAVQLVHPFGRQMAVTVAVRNLFDFRQRDPLIAPEDPFGPSFDTNYVWGPMQGRRLAVGLQMVRPR
jgi:outer membrane receptor for ferrienterochelin and colicins